MRNTKIVLFELMLCLLVIYGIFILNKKANEKNEMQNTQNKIIAEVQEITEKDEHELENQETNIENEGFEEQGLIAYEGSEKTPNVELENIISVIDGKLIWELNYSRRFFSHEETDDLLSDLKTQMYNFLRSKNIDKEKKNDKEITLSELQQGYVLDNIKYGQVNFVLRKFTTTMDSISELNGVIRTLVDTYPFLSYEIEQFSYIKETENLIYHHICLSIPLRRFIDCL